jgi:hypothetical protein
VDTVKQIPGKQIPDEQNEVFKWDEPDFELLTKSLDPFYLNGPDHTSYNRFKNRASELNESCDIFRPSDFDEKPIVCSSIDCDKKADVVTSGCPTQDVRAEAASILMEPSVDELFSLLNEDDECSEDLQKSEGVPPAKLRGMLKNAEKDGVERIVSWVQQQIPGKQKPDEQNEVFKCDGPDFELLPESPDPFYLNGSDCTTSNGFKMKGASEPNELCDIFRPSDFDDKALLRSSMDFDKMADVVTSGCPIQDATAEAASILMEPSADELFSLLNEDDECSEDLLKSDGFFPAKLHRMLENAEKDGLERIVSWVQRGTAFKVHDTREFVRRIMPLYFDQTKYESFRRQLNLYEFSRCSSKGVYFHQMFVQSDPSLCQNINRPKCRSRSQRS